MPEGLLEGLITFLGILFFFVIPLIVRARGGGQRSRQLGGLPPPAPGLPFMPEVEEPEEPEQPEEEPAAVAAAAPIPSRPAVILPPEPPPLVQPRVPTPMAPLAAPGGLPRLRRLTPWQRAVVWAEILGPPRGLQ
jgi:hypothetical protein